MQVSVTPGSRNMLLLAAAFAMAYGWGYRGTVGHEGGAMVPGALVGLVLCLGSGRLDWYRRAAVAGLFGAVGWAWGGSLSYMEQTFYVLSDSFPDVLFGYAMLFFLGALWAGIGGGVLGLALTEPRSELERLTRPFAWICAVFLAQYLYFLFLPAQAEAYYTLTVREFHNGDWLAAATALGVSGVYWLARPKDRPATALLLAGSAAWWVGYLGLTKFGGLRLAPLHRSENWSGILGVLIVLVIYLARRKNRAALMLCLYGILGGGLAFSFAVFLRHPLVLGLGPFRGWPQWRFAEDTFGLFMGLAIALGAWRLVRGGIAPPREDTSRAPLDVFGVFMVLVAVVWVNFRRHAAPQLARVGADPAAAMLGIPAWMWFVFGGALATAPLLYVLYRYLRGDRELVPQSAFGKAMLVTLALLWVTVAGYAHHTAGEAIQTAGNLLLWIPAGLATAFLLSSTPRAAKAGVPADATASASDPKWSVGAGYWLLAGITPLFLLGITGLSTSMQSGPAPGMGRQRFGPGAYWRQTALLFGSWKVTDQVTRTGKNVSGGLPLLQLDFDENRNVVATLPSGRKEDIHQWFRKNQYTWLRWRGKIRGDAARAEIPLEFHGSRIHLAWPPDKPGESYLVLERTGN